MLTLKCHDFCLADAFTRSRICVPTSDAIDGSIGEAVEEIPSMGGGKYLRIQGRYPQLIQNSVPVVVTFTKFDVVILIEGTNLLRPSHSFSSIIQDILLTSADEFVTGRVFPRKCESQSIRTIQGIVSFPVGRDPGAEPAKFVQGSSTLLSIELH